MGLMDEKRRGRFHWGRIGLIVSLMTTTALCVAASASLVWAQPSGAQSTRSFNIPPQPLADALVQFGYQSGLQVAADGGLAASARSPGVSGNYAPAEALS